MDFTYNALNLIYDVAKHWFVPKNIPQKLDPSNLKLTFLPGVKDRAKANFVKNAETPLLLELKSWSMS